MILVHDEMEVQGALRCKYHSWSYNLDGELKGTPHLGGIGQQKSDGFNHCEHGLKPVRSTVWMDVVFINLSGDAPAFHKNSGLRPQDIVEMSHWPENNRRIAERHYAAVLDYTPEPYPGTVTLFRSRFQSPFLNLGFKMGWERVAQGGVEVVPVPGGHLSILAPPHVDELARKMRRLLEGRRATRRSA